MNWLFTAFLVTAIDLTTSQTTCPSTECPEGLRCWNSTPSEVRVGWGFEDFGVCLSPENCFPVTVNGVEEYGGKLDDVNFTYEVKPIVVQRGDILVFHSLEDNLQLDLVQVSEEYFNECRRVGRPLKANITGNEIRINTNDLNRGENYIIHKGRRNSQYRCDFGLKVEVFVKDQLCSANTRDPLCNHHGNCVSSPGKADSHFTCQCCQGYSGYQCTNFRPVLDCANNPCKNGALCRVKNGLLECDCKPGFTGRFCGSQLQPVSSPTVNTGVTAPKQKHLEWITVQTQVSELSCQSWQESDSKKYDLLGALYEFIRDGLIPTAIGYCEVEGTNYGLDSDSRDLICYNNQTVFRVSLTTPRSVVLTTSELLCITQYYLDSYNATFDVFGRTFQIDSSFPLPVYSLPANEIDCDDKEVMERLCIAKKYAAFPTSSPDVTRRSNATIPKEGGVVEDLKSKSPWVILYVMIPICLLLILIMAIGLYLWKRKYTRSYTFRENVQLAKTKGYGRPRSMDVETQIKRKEYLYGQPQNGEAKNGTIPDRQSSASPVPGSANSTLQLPRPRSRVSSDTPSKRSSRGSDVRRISSDDVKILAVQPREENSPHVYENRAFQYIDDKEDSSDIVEIEGDANPVAV